MAIVTGDRYVEKLVKFVDEQAGALLDGTKVLKLNPAGLHYVHSRLEALQELERLLTGAPVDYLRAYISDLGDHRALEQLRRILRLLTSLKVVSVLPPPARDPTPLSLLPFGRLKFLELRGCDLSTSAAKGLLELRHTLEKIVCHNSTDALRHVFASRIADIRDCPQWNRLSFVSCACNRLLLMDESLQLLPAVETLDLSRNKFAKVDNLRKGTKLKLLDLGFNHLRSISSFSEVSCHIVNLVLRNNALTTLRGIENLKSLEGLDVSYNIISNFSELEFLTGLPFLQNLWLEGNPLCCARWYRAQVFSYFAHPENLKLDDMEISTREYWKRRIIIASRQKRPASFGFYSPAKTGTGGMGIVNRKKRKASRLAAIEIEEESTCIFSDQESVSYDADTKSRENNAISDDEAEIVDLMNRVEQLKKDRSIFWLREFKEWMDHASENFVDGGNDSGVKLQPGKENLNRNKKNQRQFSESYRFISDSVQASGDESSTNVLESDNSFADMSTGLHAHRYFDIVSLGITGGVPLPGMSIVDQNLEFKKSSSHEGIVRFSIQEESSRPSTFAVQEDNKIVENLPQVSSIDDGTESHLLSGYPVSPPHYQEDLLHRRQNLVEEILQLSADSYSVASSDSDTSCSEDDFCESGTSVNEYMNRIYEGPSASDVFEGNYRNEVTQIRENGRFFTNTGGEQTSSNLKLLKMDQSLQSGCNDKLTDSFSLEINSPGSQDADKRKIRRKPKRRVVSLWEENMAGESQASQKSNGSLDFSDVGIKDKQGKQVFKSSDHRQVDGRGDFIEDYFNKNIADSRVEETCRQYMWCNCLLDQCVYTERESICREVALVLSSQDKLYMLLVDVAFDGSGTNVSLLGCHSVEDIREVLVGLGLQVVRVYIEGSTTYLFVTRGVEKSRQLLHTLKVFDACASDDKSTLRSLEQVQAELFYDQICGGSKVSIFQYSMVDFWQGGNEEGSWLSRSLFVIGGHVLVCVEDIMQFSTFSNDANSSPYFSLDSCCSISDVTEMVMEGSKSWCVTMAIKSTRSKLCPSTKANKEASATEKVTNASGSQMWKLKWFSEESLSQFVALLKAIHLGTALSPLLVRCVS